VISGGLRARHIALRTTYWFAARRLDRLDIPARRWYDRRCAAPTASAKDGVGVTTTLEVVISLTDALRRTTCGVIYARRRVARHGLRMGPLADSSVVSRRSFWFFSVQPRRWPRPSGRRVTMCSGRPSGDGRLDSLLWRMVPWIHGLRAAADASALHKKAPARRIFARMSASAVELGNKRINAEHAHAPAEQLAISRGKAVLGLKPISACAAVHGAPQRRVVRACASCVIVEAAHANAWSGVVPDNKIVLPPALHIPSSRWCVLGQIAGENRAISPAPDNQRYCRHATKIKATAHA